MDIVDPFRLPLASPLFPGTIAALMHRRLLAIALTTLLAACAARPPSSTPIFGETESSAATSEGEIVVTPEPFELLPSEQTLSGAYVPTERTGADGVLQIGNGGSEVTVFLNAQSPYSQEFQQSKMPLLIHEFVRPGDAAIRIVPLALKAYAGSEMAAIAVACASTQGKGYAVHTLMFETGKTELSDAEIETLGLDATNFESCITSPHESMLRAYESLAREYGVTRVPSYVIEDEVFVGLPTDADLRGAMQSALQ